MLACTGEGSNEIMDSYPSPRSEGMMGSNLVDKMPTPVYSHPASNFIEKNVTVTALGSMLNCICVYS